MGILDTIRTRMPGSPVSVAKTLLNAYSNYREAHPNASKEDALRHTIESRYGVIKTIRTDEIEDCLAEAKSLSHLTFLVIAKENPAVAHPRHMKETVLDLYNFFNKNAPDEIDRSFAKLVEVLSTPV